MFGKILLIPSAAKRIETYLYKLKWLVFAYYRYASQSKVVIINLFSICMTHNENGGFNKS